MFLFITYKYSRLQNQLHSCPGPSLLWTNIRLRWNRSWKLQGNFYYCLKKSSKPTHYYRLQMWWCRPGWGIGQCCKKIQKNILNSFNSYLKRLKTLPFLPTFVPLLRPRLPTGRSRKNRRQERSRRKEEEGAMADGGPWVSRRNGARWQPRPSGEREVVVEDFLVKVGNRHSYDKNTYLNAFNALNSKLYHFYMWSLIHYYFLYSFK